MQIKDTLETIQIRLSIRCDHNSIYHISVSYLISRHLHPALCLPLRAVLMFQAF